MQAVPGHGTTIPVAMKGQGGARGWNERSKVSMMIMRPPQHGHDGRGSDEAGSTRSPDTGLDGVAAIAATPSKPVSGERVDPASSDPRPSCPCCGGRMIIIETFERSFQPRAPPCPFMATGMVVP